MRIFEIADPNAQKLLAMTQVLAGLSKDTASKKEISKQAFINLGKNLKVNLTNDNLADYISQEPLVNVLEPMDANSDVIRFKGNTDTEPATGMSVDQARATVDSNAKAAMKRRQ